MSKRLSTKIFSLFISSIFILGLIIIGATYWYLNPVHLRPSGFLDKSPLTSAPTALTLVLTNPDNNLLVFDPDLLISGQTAPGATVIISFEDSDIPVDVNQKGEFSFTAKLDEGVNQFIVSSFDSTGQSKSEKREIYYSKDKIE